MTGASAHYEPEWMFSDLPPLTPAELANWLKPTTNVLYEPVVDNITPATLERPTS
jgi:hypothetical protein